MTCVLSMNPIYSNRCGFNEEPTSGDFGAYNWIPNSLADCTCRFDSHNTMCRKAVGKSGKTFDWYDNNQYLLNTLQNIIYLPYGGYYFWSVIYWQKFIYSSKLFTFVFSLFVL